MHWNDQQWKMWKYRWGKWYGNRCDYNDNVKTTISVLSLKLCEYKPSSKSYCYPSTFVVYIFLYTKVLVENEVFNL